MDTLSKGKTQLHIIQSPSETMIYVQALKKKGTVSPSRRSILSHESRSSDFSDAEDSEITFKKAKVVSTRHSVNMSSSFSESDGDEEEVKTKQNQGRSKGYKLPPPPDRACFKGRHDDATHYRHRSHHSHSRSRSRSHHHENGHRHCDTNHHNHKLHHEQELEEAEVLEITGGHSDCRKSQGGLDCTYR